MASLIIFLLIGAFGFYKLIAVSTDSAQQINKFLIPLYKLISKVQLIPAVLRWQAGFIWGGVIIFFIIILTLLFGRFYCSMICPLGIFQDFVVFIRKKIFRQRKNISLINFKNIKYFIFGIFFIFSLLGGVISVVWFAPYSIFGRFLNGINPNFYNYHATGVAELVDGAEIKNFESFDVNKIYIITIISTSVMLLILGINLVSRRFFCHNLCPIGTLLGFISKKPLVRLTIIPENCIQCSKCIVNCAGDSDCLDIKHKKLNNDSCVLCMNCLTDCKSAAVRFSLKRVKTYNKISDIDDKFNNISRRQFLMALGCGGISGIIGTTLMKNNTDSETERLLKDGLMPVMPPGAKKLAEFKSRCIGCHKCVRACPTNVLQVATFNYGGISSIFLPYLDFDAGMCNNFCVKCVNACPTSALQSFLPEKRKLLKIGRVKYNQDICVVETNHKACGACAEHCPTGAIEMVEFSDGLTIPKVNDKYCIGCGACQNICPVLPVKAITVAGVAEQKIIVEKPEEVVFEKIVHEEEFPF